MTQQYKFQHDYKTNSETEYYLLKEMEEFNGQVGELKSFGTILHFKRGTNHWKDFPYIEIPPRWLTPIEPELSEAEKWLKEWDRYNNISNFSHSTTIKNFCIAAHEAGQKHGAERIEKKYKPLIIACIESQAIGFNRDIHNALSELEQK